MYIYKYYFTDFMFIKLNYTYFDFFIFKYNLIIKIYSRGDIKVYDSYQLINLVN